MKKNNQTILFSLLFLILYASSTMGADKPKKEYSEKELRAMIEGQAKDGTYYVFGNIEDVTSDYIVVKKSLMKLLLKKTPEDEFILIDRRTEFKGNVKRTEDMKIGQSVNIRYEIFRDEKVAISIQALIPGERLWMERLREKNKKKKR